MRSDLTEFERERLVGQLMADFRQNKEFNLKEVAELEAQLTPAERAVCGDSLVALRTRAFCSSGKYGQAYKVLSEGLRQFPHSLGLANERGYFLGHIAEKLTEVLHQDPLNPVVEVLYKILAENSVLSIDNQVAYLEHLVGHERFAEAARLAVPLVVLYPNVFGLRENIEVIAQKVPRTEFGDYLRASSVRLGRPFETREVTEEMFEQMKLKYPLIREAISDKATPVHVIEKMLREVIGNLDKETVLNTELKDYYYMQAIMEERKGNYFEALILFRTLVEMDPCNLNFRRSMEVELEYFCSELEKQIQADNLKVNLVEIYPILLELGRVPWSLLAHVCLEEARRGMKESAQRKLDLLLALNPHDVDYQKAAERLRELDLAG
ncbi:MAG: hypothetical protein IT288_09370 [Bdellovibrionales bacterium]|nr:hypothetical protein [Bdellovibrionales bacterium]